MLDRMVLPAGEGATLPPVPSVSIVLVAAGVGSLEEQCDGGFLSDADAAQSGLQQYVRAGKAFVVLPGLQLRVKATEPLLIFRGCAKHV
eukprot:80709-Prymnesium_polylepis.1